ncbi:MAG TPA: glycosyltransferase family 4 protein [Solirubrobacteraceae bacterium]|jgi:glycosyltransferase involved in cell wall biosynthesis|nr:glycosyltransferase family 4 protein [Solirubrobacteraceae bacterium]
MRVHLVDPSAYTPPYDHALAAALTRAGAEVDLVTSAFAYGSVPTPDGYAVRELFYRHARGGPGSAVRRATKLAEHVPDMLRYRRAAAAADVVHFQWLALQWLDPWLLPDRPLVVTAHDLLPREPRPAQEWAQRRCYEAVDALVVHSEYGRQQLIEATGLDPAKVHVIHHGAFDYLTRLPRDLPLTPELRHFDGPVVLFFGLLRPYKGIEVLLDAWLGLSGAELWIVGRPRMPVEPLTERAPPGVRFLPRFVADREIPALFGRADIVVLPYSRTERFDFSGVLATALAFGKPVVLTDVGGFSEIADTGAALLVPPDDPGALREALSSLIDDPGAREPMAAAATAAAAGPYSWDESARRTLELYRTLAA